MTGVCKQCNGRGVDAMSDNVNWLPCHSCGTSGKCTMCKGEGFIEGKDYPDGSYTTSRPCPRCSGFIVTD
jgi:hypothetical protein